MIIAKCSNHHHDLLRLSTGITKLTSTWYPEVTIFLCMFKKWEYSCNTWDNSIIEKWLPRCCMSAADSLVVWAYNGYLPIFNFRLSSTQFFQFSIFPSDRRSRVILAATTTTTTDCRTADLAVTEDSSVSLYRHGTAVTSSALRRHGEKRTIRMVTAQ